MMRHFIFNVVQLSCVLSAMFFLLVGTAAADVAVPIDYVLPQNGSNTLTLVGDMENPITQTRTADVQAYGTMPCIQYMTFNPTTHAAATTGVTFIYNETGTISLSDATVSYGSVVLGADLSTEDLKLSIYTPTPASAPAPNPPGIGPVNPDGTFDNTYHYLEVNSGIAHLEAYAIIVGTFYEEDFNFSAEPSVNQAVGTAGPIAVSAATNPHGVIIDGAGYHVTYDYTTQLSIPVEIEEAIDEEVEGYHVTGTLTVSGTLTTDPYQFSHTFDYLLGDANLDGPVNLADLGILIDNYGTTSGATWAIGDFNDDDKVSLADLSILIDNYGSQGVMDAEGYRMLAEAGIIVPEPSSLALLICGLFGLGLRLAGYARLRRRR